MAKETHYCAICGNGYVHCEYCSGVKSYSPWRNIVDTIDHYKIFITVKDYNEKTINKNEAKSQLEDVNITGWEKFKPNAVEVIREILADNMVSEEIKSETEVTFADNSKYIKKLKK